MTKYLDCYGVWNDLFPFGRLLLDYYWVLEGVDDDDDGVLEGAIRYEVGHALGYKIETHWGEIEESTHRCDDGSVVPGARVAFNAVITLAGLGPLIPVMTRAVSGNLEVYSVNCASGALTKGVPLVSDLRSCLREMTME